MSSSVKPNSKIYFIGIGGTGMATVAGLCHAAGYQVRGSDAGLYPPMSHMLEDLGIDVKTPYSKDNVNPEETDLFVVANVLSRGHEELEAALATDVPHTSFPKLLGDLFLDQRAAAVVAGTHGKTTTSSLLAHVLHALGEDPSFVIGGIPRNFPRSFRLGEGKTFVIEGDEYDTAFFDKGPKFLHYKPKYLIFNNLEFDHADIYDSVEAIEEQFIKLCHLVPNKRNILANVDDEGVLRTLTKSGLLDDVTAVATAGRFEKAHIRLLGSRVLSADPAKQVWAAKLSTAALGDFEIESTLTGDHNMANLTQVVATLLAMEDGGALTNKLSVDRLQAAFAGFRSVARRLDHLASANGIDVYEDFAHHPTAVAAVINGFRKSFPDRRVVVAFEPRSATQRRNVFQAQYAQTLDLADRVYIGKCPVDTRIPEAERMNVEGLRSAIGTKAQAFAENDELLSRLSEQLESGDAVIFMSSGSFSGIQHELASNLRSKAST